MNDRTDEHTACPAASQVNIFPFACVRHNLALQTLACRAVAQSFKHPLRAAFQSPGRKTGRERSARSRVRINVCGDVESRRACSFDALEDFRHPPPVLFVSGLEMP